MDNQGLTNKVIFKIFTTQCETCFYSSAYVCQPFLPAHEGGVADQTEESVLDFGSLTCRQVGVRKSESEQPQSENLSWNFGGVFFDFDDPKEKVDPRRTAEKLTHRWLAGNGSQESETCPFLELISS
jgi:hypothetical protein